MDKENLIRHLKEKDQIWGQINERMCGVLKLRGLNKNVGLLENYELENYELANNGKEDMIRCSYENAYYGEYETEHITFPIDYIFDCQYQKKEIKRIKLEQNEAEKRKKNEKKQEQKVEKEEWELYKKLHKKYGNK
jgi:hypothetical protein